MFGNRCNKTHRRRGSALIVAMLLMAVFTAVSAAIALDNNLKLQCRSNMCRVLSARLAGESGMAFMLRVLQDVRMSPTTSSDTLIANLGAELAETFNGTANLSGQPVSAGSDVLTIPPITLKDGSFTTQLQMVPDGLGGQVCQMVVTGNCDGVSRDLSIRLSVVEKSSRVFEYGVASRGRIRITGSAVVDGVNNGQEASILSTRSEPLAIEAGGHATIGGDLFVTGNYPDYVELKGNGLTVAGTSDIDEIIADHLHLGVDSPQFPEINVAPFAAMTTSVIDSNTDLNAQSIYSNIRVAAGTNPDFHSGTTINGVLYIEAPNVVTFKGNTTINGIIVTQDGSAYDISQNQIDFRAQTTALGVSVLPDTDEFAAVKQQTGTIIVAPGFGLTFRGTTNSINGTIAADQIAFRGNSNVSGDLSGTILGLKNLEMTLHGNATILLDKDGADDTPAGFIHPVGLAANPSTYKEGS